MQGIFYEIFQTFVMHYLSHERVSLPQYFFTLMLFYELLYFHYFMGVYYIVLENIFVYFIFLENFPFNPSLNFYNLQYF